MLSIFIPLVQSLAHRRHSINAHRVGGSCGQTKALMHSGITQGSLEGCDVLQVPLFPPTAWPPPASLVSGTPGARSCRQTHEGPWSFPGPGQPPCGSVFKLLGLISIMVLCKPVLSMSFDEAGPGGFLSGSYISRVGHFIRAAHISLRNGAHSLNVWPGGFLFGGLFAYS